MKAAPPIILLFACCAASAAGQASGDPASSRGISARLAREIRSTFPVYEPPAVRPERLEAGPAEPGVVQLPEMIVRERPGPRSTPDDWLEPRARAERVKQRYLAGMNGPTALLNAWAFPILSPSVKARAAAEARAEHFREETRRLDHVAAGIAAVDPAAAAGLRRELVNLRTGRPPGR